MLQFGKPRVRDVTTLAFGASGLRMIGPIRVLAERVKGPANA